MLHPPVLKTFIMEILTNGETNNATKPLIISFRSLGMS